MIPQAMVASSNDRPKSAVRKLPKLCPACIDILGGYTGVYKERNCTHHNGREIVTTSCPCIDRYLAKEAQNAAKEVEVERQRTMRIDSFFDTMPQAMALDDAVDLLTSARQCIEQLIGQRVGAEFCEDIFLLAGLFCDSAHKQLIPTKEYDHSDHIEAYCALSLKIAESRERFAEVQA